MKRLNPCGVQGRACLVEDKTRGLTQIKTRINADNFKTISVNQRSNPRRSAVSPSARQECRYCPEFIEGLEPESNQGPRGMIGILPVMLPAICGMQAGKQNPAYESLLVTCGERSRTIY